MKPCAWGLGREGVYPRVFPGSSEGSLGLLARLPRFSRLVSLFCPSTIVAFKDIHYKISVET